jgi:hypothetical protein
MGSSFASGANHKVTVGGAQGGGLKFSSASNTKLRFLNHQMMKLPQALELWGMTCLKLVKIMKQK